MAVPKKRRSKTKNKKRFWYIKSFIQAKKALAIATIILKRSDK